MSDESTPPTAEQIAAAQESATALVASSVADLVVLIEGADLLTLQYALAAEQAKGDAARKGALAALQAAVDGHPENAATAAAAAEAPVEVAPDVPADLIFIDDAPHDPIVEAEATRINAELAATLVPMSHPDNGACDRYATDANGHILVPASEAADMTGFGFVVVEG